MGGSSTYPGLYRNRDGTFYFKDVTFISTSFGQSADSMISTPNDIVKWLNELFNGKIITNKSLENMTKIISEKDTKFIKIQISTPKKLKNSQLFDEIGAGSGIGVVYLKNNGITWVHAGGSTRL